MGQEPCVKCNRVDCPTFTMPTNDEHPENVSKPYPDHIYEARRLAMIDCDAHAVDWRRRALEAEARERWVPVRDGLPDYGVEVLACLRRVGTPFDNVPIIMGASRSLIDGDWCFDDESMNGVAHVTHWRAMPAAPEVP